MSIWGKIAGGAAGLVIGGPIGALLGALAGHTYDRYRDAREPVPAAPDGAPALTDDETRQVAFATVVIVLAAKLAKADGVVAREEVTAFRRFFAVRDEDVGGIARIYDAAKATSEGYEAFARQAAKLFFDHPEILSELLHGLFTVAAADGRLAPAELDYLRRVARILGFDGRTFDGLRARFDAAHPARSAEPDPYAVLGLTEHAPDEEVRAAHRRLVREHHPDRLTARGLPEEFVAQANRTLAAINAAHDTIVKRRSGR